MFSAHGKYQMRQMLTSRIASGTPRPLPNCITMTFHDTSQRNRKKMLIVDDEALLRMVASDYVKDAGLEAIEADSADEALAIPNTVHGICAVFTDIQMPGSMDGLELAALIRQRWPHIAVIVASGRVVPSGDQLPAGVSFLAKPYGPAEIASLLRQAEALPEVTEIGPSSTIWSV
jgi:CheY-like chemotaxis protein